MKKRLVHNILKIISHIYVKLFLIFANVKISSSVFLFNRLKISGSNSFFCQEGIVYKCGVRIRGRRNTVEIRGGLYHSQLNVMGSGNTVHVLDGVKIIRGNIVIKGDNLELIIGPDTTSLKGVFILMGKSNHIWIGKECMLADGANIWASDSHPIFNITDLSEPVNPSTPIEIGDHVWMGKDSVILKGTKIGNDAIIGMKSVVTKDVPEATIVAGNPARQIKSGVTWDRNHISI